ncbi:hypothetical protein SAMN03159382_04174 [Pseudomonas sp. NFACC23-1]|nr:hypothetical protein SAMN03159386_04181 [Pseudomonas sp. NFACC17-2]SEJ75267.1 hypothetical protein SAMN03159382_04174 [Pseudomonas sp. NFACC23-1]SFW86714.1 hypothetical protein SAMN05660640_04566 [Pseudomonas sp. NFACC16-2]
MTVGSFRLDPAPQNSGQVRFLWRGDLSPLECAALTKGAAAQPSGDKSPRHKSPVILFGLWSEARSGGR